MAGRKHIHLTCTRMPGGGQLDQHGYVVAHEYAVQEVEIAYSMGYTVGSEPCDRRECLGPERSRER